MAEQYLPTRTQTKLKNLCISCDTPSAFGFSSQTGESASTGKSLLALGDSNESINATTIETINLIAQNTESQILNADVGQFYTLEVVEVRGFRATGDIDFNGSNMVNINIDSGTLDNVIIGGEDPTEATFTDLRAIGASGFACFDWDSEKDTLSICGSMFITGAINFGASGTTIFGDGADLYMDVTGIYYQDINEEQYLTIGGTQTVVIGQNQFLSVSGSTTESFGNNLNTTVGNNQTTTVNNTYDINVGSTYSVETFGPLSLTSNDDLNLHADGCLNITAHCLNMTIGATSQLYYGDTITITSSLDTIINEDENKTILGSYDLSLGLTGLIHADDLLTINSDNGLLLSTSGAPLNIESKECINITSDKCVNINAGTTMNLTVEDEFLLSTSGEIKLYTESKIVRLLDDSCIYIGDEVSFCGSSGVVQINSAYEVLFNVAEVKIPEGSAISASCIYLGTTSVSICGDSTDLDIFVTGCLNQDIRTCVDLSVGASYNQYIGTDYYLNVNENYTLGISGDSSTTVEGNKTTLTWNNETIGVSGSTTTNIGTDYTLTIGNDYISTINNQYDINVGNTYSVDSFGPLSLTSNDDMNLHADGCLNITADCLNMTIGTSSSFLYGGDVSTNIQGSETKQISENYYLTVTNLGITTTNETKQINGYYNQTIGTTANLTYNDLLTIDSNNGTNISVSGAPLSITTYDCFVLNSYNCIDIHAGSTMKIIASETYDLQVVDSMTVSVGSTYNLQTTNDASITSQTDINLTATDCIDLGASCINITGNLTVTGTVTLPPIIEQQWVKYNDFEAIGTTQYVFVASSRSDGISGAGDYYWDFCNDVEESFYISYDITQKILEAGSKGFKLQSIHPYYEVLNDNLKSASINIIKHSLDNFNPTLGRTGVPLEFDETELNDSIGITRYYPSIGVSGEFLKGHESIMVELCFDKNVATDLHFYGMTIEFTTAV